MIYLDHAASTPIDEDVLELLSKSLKEDFANSSSKHKLGRSLQEELETIRQKIKKLMCAGPEWDLVFTSSATESNNLFFNQLEDDSELKQIYSFSDHKSMTVPLERGQVRHIDLKLNREGKIDLTHLKSKLDVNIGLVSFSIVNNNSGVLQDYESICELIKSTDKNIKIHLDAVQAMGKYPINLKNANFDGLTFSAHKIGGPKGVAGLFIKSWAPLKALLKGGGHENGWRSSTVNIPLIKGLELALVKKLRSIKGNLDYVQSLKQI